MYGVDESFVLVTQCQIGFNQPADYVRDLSG
jgi:hypothetical protein